jgi:hypothetical protein
MGNFENMDVNLGRRQDSVAFPLVLPGKEGSSVGECSFTHCAELIHEPWEDLLESMEKKRKASGSSSLSLPRHATMTSSWGARHFFSESGALHSFIVLFRSEKDEDRLQGATDEGAATKVKEPALLAAAVPVSPATSTRSVTSVKPRWRIHAKDRYWVEWSRTDVTSFDENPLFDRLTVSTDDVRGKAKGSVMILAFNAAYLGSQHAPPGAVEDVALEQCTLIGGCATTLQALLATSTLVASNASKGGGSNLEPATARGAAAARKARRSTGPKGGLFNLSVGTAQLSLSDVTEVRVQKPQPLGADGTQSITNAAHSFVLLPLAAPQAAAAAAASASSSAAALPSLQLSGVALFTPSSATEDLEKAHAKLKRKLAKAAESARTAQLEAEDARTRAEEDRTRLKVELTQKRLELQAQIAASAQG